MEKFFYQYVSPEYYKELYQNSYDFRLLCVLFGLTFSGVLGRILLQYVPSVETILPVAIITGALYGRKTGFGYGANAFFISNFFVWGFQGLWTPFQCLGAGIAGMLGGFLYGKEISRARLLVVVILSTAIFEAIMNVQWWILTLGRVSLPLMFLTSLPFSAVHIGSNIAFSPLMLKAIKRLRA